MRATQVLDGLAFPDGWGSARLNAVAPRSKASGRPDLQSLSVYLDAGVVPRADRADNHNVLGEDLSKYLHVKPGDVVFNKLRTWQGGLGVARDEGIVSPAYFVCRPRPGVEPRFVHYLLRSAPYLAELTRRSKWMPPSQFDITWDELKTLPVVLPPLDEQRRIADFLDTEAARLDHLLEARAMQSSRLSERRSSLLLSLVGGREGSRVTSGLEWLPTVPAHWSTVRLTLLARLGSGHTPSRSHPEWWLEPRIPWITTGEVAQLRDDRLETLTETRERVSELGLANSAAEVHPRGTVVLSRTASVGFSAVMGLDMATSQDFATWTCGPRLDPYFLLWTLRAMRPWLIGARAIGSTHKTIYMPDIQALRIPVPPIAEQHVIVDWVRLELGHLDRVRHALDAQSALLRERRQALITAAVTGQFDVTTARRNAGIQPRMPEHE